MQEPINEAFGTRLHRRLGCKNYVPYEVIWENGVPYCVCENFINVDTELVSAVSINRSMKKSSQFSSYEHFLKACDRLGIPGMKKFIDYMLGSKVQNDLVPKLGYISIDKMQVERDSNNHVVQK